MTIEPVYTPAAWFVAGCTCAPTHTNSAPVPLRVGFAPAAGANRKPPTCVATSAYSPVKLTIGMVLPPDDSGAGRVKERGTGVLAWPGTSNRPAFVRSVAATVLFTPGNTLPKLNC